MCSPMYVTSGKLQVKAVFLNYEQKYLTLNAGLYNIKPKLLKTVACCVIFKTVAKGKSLKNTETKQINCQNGKFTANIVELPS